LATWAGAPCVGNSVTLIRHVLNQAQFLRFATDKTGHKFETVIEMFRFQP